MGLVEFQKIFGVSVHPEYGGWFALRCVLIFRNVRYPALPQRQPRDVVTGDENRVKLLEGFTDHWQDGAYRDIVPVSARYSQRQRDYFATLPKNRRELINQWTLDGFVSETRTEEDDANVQTVVPSTDEELVMTSSADQSR